MSASGPGVVLPPVDGPCGAAFTTRAGGVSAGPYAALNLAGTVSDAPDAVRANRVLICDRLGIDPQLVRVGTQVHGVAVRPAGDAPADGRFLDPEFRWPEGDALVCNRPGSAVGVFGADCLPVLLWHRDRPLVAAVHAGWRGLVGGVLEAAIDALGGGARLGAAIGVGIGPCCYPVSAQLRDRFASRFGEGVVRGPAVDLADAAGVVLARQGVPRARIWVLDGCTACEPERWFSFRRDGAPTGRQAGLIWPLG